MKNLPQDLAAAVERVRHAAPDRRSAQDIINCLDMTLVSRHANAALVSHVCREADQGAHGRAASVTLHPNFLGQAFNFAARRRVPLAVVVNYPDGGGTPDQTARDTRLAVNRGVGEVEIVLDHKSLRTGDKTRTRALLAACRQACGTRAKMKVVLESDAFPDYGSLYDAASLAIAAGADMLVTAPVTESPRARTTLAAAATILRAIRDNNRGTGFKVGGEMDNARAHAPYIALARAMMGDAWVKPENFRIGGRNVLNEALRILGHNPRP